MAVLLRDALRAVDVVAGGPDVIVAIHSAPAGVRSFHWHVHVWPRLATAGGFELGSGLGVATVEPEVAAAELRAALSGSPPIDVEPAPLLLR
jgi:UDPglucose--hexose-1-phosphate uridylyltransferase